MSQEKQLVCYVSIPYGAKKNLSGAEIDFDQIYFNVLKSVLEGFGIVTFRADSLITRGSAEKAILEAILISDLMIADLTTLNPNVLYEVGVRHSVKRSGTILICSDNTEIPFDIGQQRFITYHLTKGTLVGDHANSFKATLKNYLDEYLAKDQIDSPLYRFFPSLQVEFAKAKLKRDDIKRKNEESVRRSLVEARRMLPDQGVLKLREIENDLESGAVEDLSIWIDLLKAYRDAAAWDEVVRLVNSLPEELKQEEFAVQQLAMALNRRNDSGDRDRALKVLEHFIEQTGGDSETYGLLGRIYKDQYRDTENIEALESSINAYREGYKKDANDYYPGVNLATLLYTRGDKLAIHEMKQILPELRANLRRRAESGRTDYWEMATSLELATLAGDWDAANELVLETRSRAPAQWMLETTARNLEIISEKISDSSDSRKMRSIILNLEQDFKSGW